MITAGGASGREHLGHTVGLELLDVGPRHDAAREDERLETTGAQLVDHLGDEGHMGARQQAQAHRVRILLERGFGDLARGLEQPGVDDLEARVAQRPGDHLGAAIVPVQAGLGDHDAVASKHPAPPVVAVGGWSACSPTCRVTGATR